MKSIVDDVKNVIQQRRGESTDLFDGKLVIEEHRGFCGQSISDKDSFFYESSRKHPGELMSAYRV